MKIAFTFVIAVIAAIVLMVPSAIAVDGEEVKLHGKILAGENANGVDGVKISVYDNSEASDDPLDSTITGEEGLPSGEFVLTFNTDPDKSYYLKIERDGYEINQEILSNHAFLILTNRLEVVKLDMSNIPSEDTEIVIFMSPTLGTVTGTVTNSDGDLLSGVRVDYTSSDGAVRGTVFSGNDGTYTIAGTEGNGIHIGNYTIAVSHNGYKSQTITIAVERGSQAEPTNFILETNKAEYLFGLDLAHSIMIFCGLIGLVLIVLAVIYRIRLNESDDIDIDETWEEYEE